MNFKALAALSVFCIFWGVNIPVYADVNLNFGIHAYKRPRLLVEEIRPILTQLEQVLSKKLNQKVKITTHVTLTVQQNLDDIVNGKVDIASLDPASYAQAKMKDRYINLLAIENILPQKVLKSFIVTHPLSSIQNIFDVKGNSFLFSKKETAMGEYLALDILVTHFIKKTDLIDVKYDDNPKSVAKAILNRDFDVGVIMGNDFETIEKKVPHLKVLVSYDTFQRPWAAARHVSQNLTKVIKESMLEIYNVPNPDALLGQPWFLEGGDHKFKNVFKAVKNSSLFYLEE